MQVAEKSYGFELKATPEEAAKAVRCLLMALRDLEYQEVFFVGERGRVQEADVSEHDVCSSGYFRGHVRGVGSPSSYSILADLHHTSISPEKYIIIMHGTSDYIARRKTAARRLMREEHLIPDVG